MVVSFKISRNGTRYRPKSKPDSHSGPEFGDDEVDAPVESPEIQSPAARKRSVDVTDEDHNVAENLDAEVSFILNIFPDGYTIVPYEQDVMHDESKSLCPYDRRSQSLITAIELGRLPVNFLDNIPCKYINGTVICEVRDYQKESSESEVIDSLTADFPSITKVPLKMSLDLYNVVKDINLISDSRWDYGDLLEAESRILLALHPKLCLDPTPNLERLCKDPRSIKLNLDIRGKRLKRLRQLSDSEKSNSSVRDSVMITSQPDFVKVVDNNVGQGNMLATRSTNHAPVMLNTRVPDSIRLAGQPEIVNVVDQKVGQSNMIVNGPNNHAPEKSNIRVGGLMQLAGQPEFVNVVDQNVGQSNTTNFHEAPWNNISRNLLNNTSGSRGPQSLSFSDIESAKQEQMIVNQRLNTLQKTPVTGSGFIGPITARSPVDRSTQIRLFQNPNGDREMLREPISTVQSTDGQLSTNGVFTNSWVQQSLNDRESQLRNHWSHPYNRETELRIMLLRSQSERNMMGGDGSAVMGPNPIATRLGLGQYQSSSVGRLLSDNREMHPGSGSGSRSTGGLMLGSSVGAGIRSNMASGTSQMQRNVMAPPNMLWGSSHNRNHNMNQQMFHLQEQEPTWHIQATPQHVDSPSSSSRRLDEQIGPYQLTVNRQSDSQNMNVSWVGPYHQTPVSQNASSQNMNVLQVGSYQRTLASPHLTSHNMDVTAELIRQLRGTSQHTKRG